MLELEQETMFWALIAIQVFGWASFLAFRLSLGSSHYLNTIWQVAFYGSLAMVGLATLFAVTCEASCWVCPAISLGGMTIGGVSEPALQQDF